MVAFDGLPSNSYLLISVLASLIVWRGCLVIYRIFFHPLAKVPGPFLAAASSLYIFRWNAFSPDFYRQAERLHSIYGPVVRISPNEVHLSNPENYDKIHGAGSKFAKDADFYKSAGTSAFATPSNELHRARRAVINPFFSRKKVLELEDVVQTRVSILYQRMQNSFRASVPFNIHWAYRAVSVDVITDYAFDSCYNLLDREDLGQSYFEIVSQYASTHHWVVQFPFIEPMIGSLPKWITRHTAFGAFIELCEKNVMTVKKSVDAGEKMPDRTTIFHQLLDPNAGGNRSQSIDQLTIEGLVILGAASDTVGATLVRATYCVYSNPEIYQKVLAELTEAFPDPNAQLEFLKLEKLKYLTAVIKEALRIALPVGGRLPRVTPESGAEFDGFKIPAGTKVSMSMWLQHRDPSIWPSPESFNPDRWLGQESQGLDKYLVPFGKGQRICLGMPLAYCELYVTLGTIFRRSGLLKLSEMTAEDWIFRDYVASYFAGRKLHLSKSED